MIGTAGNFDRTFRTNSCTAAVILAPSESPFSITLSLFRDPIVTIRLGREAQTALTRASTSNRLSGVCVGEWAKPEPSTALIMGMQPRMREIAAGRLNPGPIIASVDQESPKNPTVGAGCPGLRGSMPSGDPDWKKLDPGAAEEPPPGEAERRAAEAARRPSMVDC